ncbi:winged helix-turn-helix domain-containing protein [Micromonospora sp. NPDC049559]|uniref:winged helix-turn-helix domain-containing protein n=1 Tax=Micromonospora sp. NPDC049559 TaxID=3155923 RepID=UPI0034311E98
MAVRRPSNPGTPSLTVTLSIPLVGEEELTPPARRLLDAALELLERGEGMVNGVSASAERRTEPAPPDRPVENGSDRRTDAPPPEPRAERAPSEPVAPRPRTAEPAPGPRTEAPPSEPVAAAEPVAPAPSASRPATAGTVPTVHILAASRSVLLDGAPLPLTRLEFDLLMHLVAYPRRVFTRLQLLTAVWGYEHTGVRTVDVHVRRLRGKFGADVPLVTTVYGVGYRLADDARVTIDRNG